MKNPLSLLLAAGLLVAAGFGLSKVLAGRHFPAEKIRQYESLFSWDETGEAPPGSIPCRTGKVVLIRPGSWQVYRQGILFLTQILPEIEDKKEKEIAPPRLDDSWHELEGEVRAGSPEEVDTVIICTPIKIPAGEYRGPDNFSGPNASLRKGVELKVYDWKSRRLIGECLLADQIPKMEAKPAGPYSGEPRQIADFVARMPLRQ
ncbi:MAG: hypothetical protein HY717_23300 [Planctomycetes bacterium]|nr:hypothetical protein [Planctomycetota bacterium]